MLINGIIITVILIALVLIVFYYKTQLSKSIDDDELESQFSLSHLQNEIAKVFAETQKENLTEMNFSRKELEAAQRKKRDLRFNLKNASFGDPSAKRYIKSLIKSILQDEAYGIDQETINSVIPFNQPRSLTTRDKIDILFYLFRVEAGDNGFAKMVSDYNLDAPKELTLYEEAKGGLKYNITAEDIDRVFEDKMSEKTLTYNDKLEIITQRIFADYTGFGPIDSLYDFAVDEIQGGVNGYAKGFLEIKPEQMDESFEYSYESVWVVFKGKNIKLGCMTFGSQEELVRVCKNIYKFQTSHALSRNEGHITAVMRDGSRVSVCRPPEASSWAFCLREFSTVGKAPTIRELFPEEKQHNVAIIETLLMWAVYSQLSVIISGGMGDGKTTTLRSVLSFLPSEKTIRVYELASELNLQASFPQRNIAAFATTETTTLQDLYDFGKKFSANVSCISEIASAEMSVVAIESGRVGSENFFSTHHATTTENLVTAITDGLTTAGGYSDVKAAEEVVVNTVNLDVHMARVGGMRFIERITAINPISDRRYPTEVYQGTEATTADTLEYYKRSTDRKLFEAVDIVRFSFEDNSYHMVNRLSDAMYNKMYAKLMGANRENFVNDMNNLYQMIGR